MKIIEFGIIALLILTPLPAASTDDWAVLAIELGAAFLAAVYVLSRRRPVLNAKLAAKLVWPGRLLIGLFVFISVQFIPIPKPILSFFSPNAVELRQAYSPHFAEIKTMTLSLVPIRTFRAALELLAYVLIGFLVVRTFVHRRQIQRLMTVLAACGAVQALYALFELYRSNPHVLFYKKVYNLGSATGTFINRNHFSGYLELIIPIALTLLLARIDMFSLAGKRWPEKMSQMTGKGFSGNVILIIAIVIMSLGVLKSQSRSGAFILVLTFVLFFELTVFHFSKARYGQTWIKTVLKSVFLLVTIGALYVGVEGTLSRFASDRLLQDGRPQYWNNVLTMFARFPVFGTGYGTFADVYPAFQTVTLEGRLVHAHNDFLENLAELGIIGFALMMGAIGFLLLDGFRTWSKRRHPQIKALGMGGFVSAAAILVHGLTDFNLHIPANAVLFSVILGLAYAAAYYRKA